MNNEHRCEHIFGVTNGTNTTKFRVKKYWFRKCCVCRSRKMFSSMLRCIECRKLVHKKCMSWVNYFEQDTQFVQCCQAVNTADVVTDSEVEITPILADVSITSDLIINESCSSVKVANITEVTEDDRDQNVEDYEVIPLVLVKNDSAINVTGQYNEPSTIDVNNIILQITRNTQKTKIFALITNSEIIAESEKTSIYKITISVTDMDAAIIVANVINLASAVVLQNYGTILANIIVRDSANAVLLRDIEQIPTAIIEKYSAVARPREDKECMNTENGEEIKIPMHKERTEAIESPKYVETIESNEIIEMYQDSEVSTKINVASIHGNRIPVTNVDVFTHEKYLTSDFVSGNHGAVIPMKDSVNSDFLLDDKSIPTAVVEKDSTSANPFKSNGPFTESISSPGNTSKVMSDNNDGKIIPDVLLIIPINQAHVSDQMNQEIFCSPTIPDQSTQLVELEKYNFEELDRNSADMKQITLIMKNLLSENVQDKSDEINAILRQEYFQWFSGYLIEECICNDLNLHELYSELLNRMDNENLNALVLLKTADKIQILLNNDSRNNRAILNNLGHWLGIITLAKNKPIPFHNSFLNSLLLRAYMESDNQRLSFIVPFASKILLSCAKSEDFGLNSHWTISVLRILAKIHKLPGLELNLQFEIEILHESLNIKLGTHEHL